MNYKSVFRGLGFLAWIVTLAMSLSLGLAAYEYFQAPGPMTWAPLYALIVSMAVGMLTGFACMAFTRNASQAFEIREALLLVSLAWIMGGLVGALPLHLFTVFTPDRPLAESEFSSFVNCLFEAISGLTTTGASILTDIERLPRPVLLWRATIQWLGGLGIIMLFVALLPWITTGQKKLYKAESTGLCEDAGSPNIQKVARTLWFVYLCMTLLQITIMTLGDSGLDLLTAVTFAFSTTATAGFSVYGQSAGSLSTFNQWVCIVFMLLSGVNYGLYCGLKDGKYRRFFKDPELRAYLAIILGAGFIIAFDIYGTSYRDMAGNGVVSTVWSALTDGLFQSVSIQTTTGFSNANSNDFPVFSKTLLCILMLIGGCGGSTGGGIKVIRIVSVFRLMFNEVEKVYRPHVVRPIGHGRGLLDQSRRLSVLVYTLLVIVLTILGTLVLALIESGQNHDFVTLGTAVLACLNNIGPGFNLVGVAGNYAFLTDGSKLFLAMLMVFGRLEVFTVLCLFQPRFWHR